MTHLLERSKLLKASTPSSHPITPPHHAAEYSHPHSSISPIPLPNRHNASHIHHQERTLNCRSPLLLRFCSPHVSGRHWFWCIKAYWICGRVSRSPICKPGQCKLTVSPAMPSPSARPLARSSTSVKKRRPSTLPPRYSTHHRHLRCKGRQHQAQNTDEIQASGHQGKAEATETAHGGPRQAHVSKSFGAHRPGNEHI